MRDSEHERQKLSTWLVELREVLVHLQDIEIGQRDFLLTGKAGDLELYDKGVDGVKRHHASLARMLSDNAALSNDLRRFYDLFRLKIAESDRAITLKLGNQHGLALEIIESEHARAKMNEMRRILVDLMGSLSGHRTARSTWIFNILNWVAYVLAAVVMVATLFIVLGYRIVVRTLKENAVLNTRFEIAAMNDPLTAIPNRRFALSWLRYAMSQANRERTRLAVLL